MRIEEYIKDLLFDFDKVIVPGFGAFIGTELFAKIDEDAQKIHPPSKDIVFNDLLKLDDGVLIGKIADERKIRKDIAIQEVQQYVEHLSTKLQSEKAYTIDGLGTLIKLDGESITFKQDKKVNYLTDAFGLQAIALPEKIISDTVITEAIFYKEEVADEAEPIDNKLEHAAIVGTVATGAVATGLTANAKETDEVEETAATEQEMEGETEALNSVVDDEALETFDTSPEEEDTIDEDTIVEEELEEVQEEFNDFSNNDNAYEAEHNEVETESNIVDFDLEETDNDTEATEIEVADTVIEESPKRFSLWLVLLPFLLLLGAGYLLFTVVGSNENPYAKEMAKIESSKTTGSTEDKIVEKEGDTNAVEKNTNEQKVDKDKTGNAAKPVSKPAKSTTGSSAVENAKPGYYVVLASTKNKPQAIKDAQKLRNKNYDAFVIPGPNNYNRVAIFAGTDAEAAETNLSEYKKAINSSAWILKY